MFQNYQLNGNVFLAIIQGAYSYFLTQTFAVGTNETPIYEHPKQMFTLNR